MDLRGISVIVNSNDESKIIQNILLENGCSWEFKKLGERVEDITFKGVKAFPRVLTVNKNNTIEFDNNSDAILKPEDLIKSHEYNKYKPRIEGLIDILKSEGLMDSDNKTWLFTMSALPDKVSIQWHSGDVTNTENITNLPYDYKTLILVEYFINQLKK